MSPMPRARRAPRPLAPLALAAVATITVAACARTPSSTAAPAAALGPDSGGYIVRLGVDTIAAERFQRTGRRLTGDVVVRTPSTRLVRYVATLAPDARITRLDATVSRPAVPVPDRAIILVFQGDSAVQTIVAGDSTVVRRVAAPAGTLPTTGYSYAILGLAVRRLLASGRDSIGLPILPIGGSRASVTTFRRLGADSVLMVDEDGETRIAIAPDGGIVGAAAPTSTFKASVARVPTVDVVALTRAFWQREQQGAAMGVLSPRDTASATIGDARLTIDYGRPAKRGRTVFGGIVPWNQVWRTGANAATGFTTTRDLVVGGVDVPAGSYTLFTLPSPDGWKLIVNRQTGQWGTDYDASRDLARIDMRTTTVAEPAERFTIAIDPQGSAGGVLRLTWDTTQAYVPFTVRATP